jgi:hypothetical protein
MVVAVPLAHRLKKVLQLLRFLFDGAVGEEVGVVKCYYMYYSYSRLQLFKSKVNCELQEIERDVMYWHLCFHPHEDPSYLQYPSV